MSTAGKVLVILVTLAAIACLFMAGGIAQLNQNGNKRLESLAAELTKAQEGIESAKREIVSLRDQTALIQEKIDGDLTVLRARQTDLERTRSQVADTLAHVQYDLSTVNATIEGAKTSLRNRNAEFDAEEKAMADLRREVQSLKSNNTQLMTRLQSLRDQFMGSYHQNIEMLGKGR
jgi:chromosome segregation ATPase